MRARGIKPQFFTDETVVELSFTARLLFIGLWCAADREGRLEDRPKQLKIRLFPCDDMDVDALLDEIAAVGLIIRYQVEGERYIQVTHFTKHQSPHVKEQESTIPAPDMPGANLVQARLIPSSLIPSSLTVDTDSMPRKRGQVRAQFDAFWETYPRHTAKGDAEKSYAKALKKVTHEEIMAGLHAHLPAWATFEKRFIPHASTWLNQDRWQDEPPELDADGWKPDTQAEAEYLSRRISEVAT